MRPWETLGRRQVLDFGKHLKVESHTIRLPDGQILRRWPWVITPDYVDVVAVTAEGKFVCLWQTKYAVKGETLAPVGGCIEPGEAPLASAKRELLEETGFRARQWTRLGVFSVGANRGFGTAHLYLARGAWRVAEPDSDDLEEQHVLLLERAEVERALDRGEFKVLSWATTVALALRRLDRLPALRQVPRGRSGRSPSRPAG